VNAITVDQLCRLKYRYLRALDLKRWDEFEETLTPDATADYGDRLTFADRAAIVSYMRENVGDGVITVHHVHHPEIEVDGDTATGTWALDDTVIVPEHRILLRGAAFYEDRYRREPDGVWRITHTGYIRTYESMVSLDDFPSWHLTSNRWAPKDAVGQAAGPGH
jgi:hypothetical protein